MLKEEPPGPIIMPARMVVSGVFLEPNTPSTSYLDFKCLDKFLLSLGNIPPKYTICFNLHSCAALAKLSARSKSVSSKLAWLSLVDGCMECTK